MKDLLERLLDEAEGGTVASAVSPDGQGVPSPEPSASPAGQIFPPSGGAGPGAGEGSVPGASAASLLQTLGALGPLLGGGGKRSGGIPDRHTALLCALKPYLSHERQQAADTLLRLSRIWDVLSQSGLSMGGILNGLSAFGGRLGGGDAAKAEGSDAHSADDPHNGSGR